MVDPSNAQRGLPWTPEKGENRRFVRILLVTLLVFLPPAVVIPMLDVPAPERSETEKVPPTLAKLVEQRQPPEPVAMPEPQPEPQADRSEPEAEPEPERTDVSRRPPDPDRQTTEQARATASRSGLFAMKEQMAALHGTDAEPVQALAANVPSGNPNEPANRRTRDDALKGSGGVVDEQAPARVAEVSGHQVREVVATPHREPVKAAAAETGPGAAERGMSNIRKVFDAQKTALYSMYRRELRQDPTLEGKVLLELVIEPDGTVSHCEVVSSDLDNPELETRIATRVRLFNFGSADVAVRRVKFPIDFLPG
ncbi:AgmX/PglI C-terminal domain-containing protein [Marinobacter sp. M-5]|uniref:AgmX/PglI C-terminal domain-containing protein n=1 Tax=Marinobacter sp. M-5 TaxID=3081089 RepID=UPI00293CA249|nr:AgmX/PglI C-terminal domain-containing protein [Marinobacter sp. M-5]MDV3503550.1 AgmX/PglI C-terminal domain-containing protein [Marinobacter sp. M-5]